MEFLELAKKDILLEHMMTDLLKKKNLIKF